MTLFVAYAAVFCSHISPKLVSHPLGLVEGKKIVYWHSSCTCAVAVGIIERDRLTLIACISECTSIKGVGREGAESISGLLSQLALVYLTLQ